MNIIHKRLQTDMKMIISLMDSRGSHTTGLAPVNQLRFNFYSAQAKETSLKLTKYFCGPGAVPFQNNRLC